MILGFSFPITMIWIDSIQKIFFSYKGAAKLRECVCLIERFLMQREESSKEFCDNGIAAKHTLFLAGTREKGQQDTGFSVSRKIVDSSW